MKVQFLKISFGILIFNFAISSLFCQNYGEEIRKLLPEGKVQFEVLDSVEATARQIKLSEKFPIAYRENYDAFNAYFEKTRNNQKAKYPKNKILSEKEFLEYMDFAKNIKLIPSQTETVEIIYSDDDYISFKASGKLAEVFSQITYHIETNTFVLADSYTLDFSESVDVKTNTNAFKEPWQGYIWVFEETENIDLETEDLPNKENIDKISMKQYKIRLGKLSSGKTIMIIGLKDLQYGNWVTRIEVTIRMK